MADADIDIGGRTIVIMNAYEVGDCHVNTLITKSHLILRLSCSGLCFLTRIDIAMH